MGDVLRLSQYTYTGSARATAMGGAFGSLGADVSSMSLNPAGMGMYRTSEMIFTAGLGYVRGKSVFDTGMVPMSGCSCLPTTQLCCHVPPGQQPLGEFLGRDRVQPVGRLHRDLAFYTPSGSTSLLDEFVNFSNLVWARKPMRFLPSIPIAGLQFQP